METVDTKQIGGKSDVIFFTFLDISNMVYKNMLKNIKKFTTTLNKKQKHYLLLHINVTKEIYYFFCVCLTFREQNVLLCNKIQHITGMSHTVLRLNHKMLQFTAFLLYLTMNTYTVN
jgi:hypothetical protein